MFHRKISTSQPWPSGLSNMGCWKVHYSQFNDVRRFFHLQYKPHLVQGFLLIFPWFSQDAIDLPSFIWFSSQSCDVSPYVPWFFPICSYDFPICSMVFPIWSPYVPYFHVMFLGFSPYFAMFHGFPSTETPLRLFGLSSLQEDPRGAQEKGQVLLGTHLLGGVKLHGCVQQAEYPRPNIPTKVIRKLNMDVSYA